MLTPMQRQYNELKAKSPDSILLFRLGDFYEMFGDDALCASKILGITLTARNKGTDNEMAMCGIPYHASENYINKLSQAGKKVAICEQISDPSKPGLVERAIVQIITPGTILSDSLLDAKTANFLVSVVMYKDNYGLAYTDISTGKFGATKINNFTELKNEILRLQPSELLLVKNCTFFEEISKLAKNISFWFLPNSPQSTLQDFFQIPNLKVFYIENEPAVINAAALLLDYILDTQKGKIKQITKITAYSVHDYLPVDIATLRNLEIFQTMQNGAYHGSLLSVIDHTVTATGGRKLKKWLLEPLKNITDIEARLQAVSQYKQNNQYRAKLRQMLQTTRDLERLLSKLASNKANPKDLVAIKETLEQAPAIKYLVQDMRNNV